MCVAFAVEAISGAGGTVGACSVRFLIGMCVACALEAPLGGGGIVERVAFD